jgi:PAS domain S-box-containing protein
MQDRIERFQRGLAAVAAALVLVTGALVLVGGWGLGVAALRGVLPGLASMKANTALAFCLCGIALWIRRGDAPGLVGRLADLAAGIAGLIGALTLAEYATGVDFGIDQLVVADWTGSGVPGRMSPFTALGFVAAAGGLLGLGHPAVFQTGQVLAAFAAFIGYFNLMGYAFSVRAPFGIGTARLVSYTEVALHTAATFVLLGVGTLHARAEQGIVGICARETVGGTVARWFLPVALVAPFGLGAVRLAGERHGYYGTEFGLALMAASNIAVFSVLTWWMAMRLHRTDHERRRAEAELVRTNEELEGLVQTRTASLAASEARYRRLIEAAPMGMFIHQDHTIRFANAAGARMLGYAAPAVIVGRPLEAFLAPEFHVEVRERVAARLRGEPVPSDVPMQALRADGSPVWIEAHATVVDWGGAPATLVSIVDISERLRRETSEREAAALRSVTQLANATAHEINNPLAVIAGNLELLQARLGGEGAGVRSQMERALGAARRIAEMVGHMSRITRLESMGGAESGLPPTLDLRRSSGQSEGAGPLADGGARGPGEEPPPR